MSHCAHDAVCPLCYQELPSQLLVLLSWDTHLRTETLLGQSNRHKAFITVHSRMHVQYGCDEFEPRLEMPSVHLVKLLAHCNTQV